MTPDDFTGLPITQENVTKLHECLDWDEEFCPEVEVWVQLFEDEEIENPTMENILAWIEPMP